MTKSEILFYYESRQNPNGDPDAENQPRLMPDQRIIVTDVRIKRTIRDYAKNKLDYTLFVDFDDKDGLPVTADKRAREIAGEKCDDYIKTLLEKTFDVPLFGGLVTIRKNKNKDSDKSTKGSSQKLTGPVQFGIAHSINPVTIIQPAITSRFVGDASKGQHTTIGRFYSVEYALIKVQGAINPTNLGKNYLKNESISEKFGKYTDEMPIILWDGTNQLITRSKYPQKSILYIQVDYKDTIYNDLPDLVSENKALSKEGVKELGLKPFDFTCLVSTLNKRKDQIQRIRIKYIDALDQDISEMLSKLDNITVEKI